ncbi:hypothetical protein [Gloeocapsopsis dulcis]
MQPGHGILGDRAFALMYNTSASSDASEVFSSRAIGGDEPR